MIASDTGPRERVLAAGHAAENVRAVFLEAAFPDSLTWLANSRSTSRRSCSPARSEAPAGHHRDGRPPQAEVPGRDHPALAALGLSVGRGLPAGPTYEF